RVAASLTRDAADDTDEDAAATADAVRALRISRLFTSERLQEGDERPLVGVAQPGFFRKVAGAEVVPLVHDEILALADRQHVVRELLDHGRERLPGLRLAFQVLQQRQPLAA